MVFIIGVWGGPRRIYAALKFVLYTMSGSLLMLVAIIYLAVRHSDLTQNLTFDLFRIYQLTLPPEEQFWLFLAFALAFAIKIPIVPLHTWLPDAHVEAPTAGSVLLAGILLKMGTYGLLRFAIPLFPEVAVTMQPWFLAVALVGIIYGALVAMVQPDLKKLIAYSSVSHLGFVVLGLFALNLNGLQGAAYQMLNHGLSTGALFLLAGMIYERTHTRQIAHFGGLWQPLPLFSAFFLLVTLSSIALPGLNGFIGEFLILLGGFQAIPPLAVGAALGMILAPIYMLWMLRRVIFGPLSRPENKTLKDLGLREIALLAPILFLIVFMGTYPQPFLDRMKPSLELVLKKVESRRASVALSPNSNPALALAKNGN
jgi:NADH-quinone oxidoreductase subunit M